MLLLIGAQLQSTKNAMRTKGGGRGMYNNKMAVARYKIRTYDVHDKRSMIQVSVSNSWPACR